MTIMMNTSIAGAPSRSSVANSTLIGAGIGGLLLSAGVVAAPAPATPVKPVTCSKVSQDWTCATRPFSTYIETAFQRKRKGGSVLSSLWFQSKPWATPEVIHYLATSDMVNFETIERLKRATLSNFPNSQIDLSVYSDNEEGWQKLCMSVTTGIDDIDLQLNLEDALYAFIDEHADLRLALNELVISFA